MLYVFCSTIIHHLDAGEVTRKKILRANCQTTKSISVKNNIEINKNLLSPQFKEVG